MSLSIAERERYRRHLALSEIGAGGQEKLKAARVLIVGAGGLGSPAALYLAAAGCGTLGLVDFDRVDVANVRALLEDYDLVVDGSDRLSTRYLVNDACVLLRRPLVSAAIHRFEGQVMTYVPGRGPCYRCLFPEAADGVVANCADAGVLGVLPGVLGALQATEAIKLITGAGTPLLGRLLTYDALELRFQEFSITRRRDCAVCGDAPSITEPRDAAPRPAGSAGVRRLSAAALRQLLDQGQGAP